MAGSNEALADAFSGVVGTLVSLWCFYPIERIKTNLQAGKSLSLTPSKGWSSSTTKDEKDLDRIQRQAKIVVELIQHYFRGCGTKSLHATSSSFVYFYVYSWILSHYNNKRMRNNRLGSKQAPIRPSTRLLLSAIAAMMNTFVTLPLDVLSSKRTVENANEKHEMDTITPKNSNAQNDRKELMEKTWQSIMKKEGKPLPEMTTSSFSLSSTSASASSSASSSTTELVFHEACSRSEELFSLHQEMEEKKDDDHDENNTSTYSITSTISTSSILSNNDEYKLRWKERLEQRKVRRLQRQLNDKASDDSTEIITNAADSIDTCTSTSTFNTDVATNAAVSTKSTTSSAAFTANVNLASIRRWSKLWKGLVPALLLCSNPSIHYTVFDVLKTKLLAWKRLGTRRGIRQQQQLSVSEAFVLGLLSKFVATIVTYPLIRAKVMMMVQGDHPVSGTESESEGKATPESFSSPTLWSVLKESYHRDGGVSGLYKGCDWQLIHTLLKSALMMAIREQITDTTRAMFGVSSK